MTVVAQSVVTRAEVEDFLYHEAALLDGWQLDEWLALLTEDARYEVPWSLVSRGMGKNEEQLNTDEPHLRAFWVQWNKLMTAAGHAA